MNGGMIPGPQYLILFFVAIVGAVGVLLARRSRPLGLAMGAWVLITGVLGAAGLVQNFSRTPPPLLLLVVFSFALTTFVGMSSIGTRLISDAGIAWIVGLQTFRIAVEIFLDLGHHAGIVPVQMTFEGRNWDVLSGISAAILAWLLANGKAPRWLVLVWNCVGLALLLNIVIVAVLSMPTPFRRFHNELPNTFVTHFPYVWLPTFLVQVAWLGHLLALRWLWRRAPSGQS